MRMRTLGHKATCCHCTRAHRGSGSLTLGLGGILAVAEVKGKQHQDGARRLVSDLNLPNNKVTLKQPRLTAEAQSIQQNQKHMGRLLYHNGCHVVLNNKPTCHETLKEQRDCENLVKKRLKKTNKQKTNRTS